MAQARSRSTSCRRAPGRAHPRRRLRARRRADADRRRHHRRGGQAARSRSTARTICWRRALRADFALVHAFLADYLGNLSYALTARNFNPVMAMAADTVIVTRRPHRAGRRDRARPRRDAGSARRLPRRQRVNAMDAQTIIAKRIAQELRPGNAGQSRHRHSDPGRELRAAGHQRLLPVGERLDRHRTDPRTGHGASAADRRRRPAGQRAAGRLPRSTARCRSA